MYYTKKEYNSLKSALLRENMSLKKQIRKLLIKIEVLEYAHEVVFEPDFEMNPVAEETAE